MAKLSFANPFSAATPRPPRSPSYKPGDNKTVFDLTEEEMQIIEAIDAQVFASKDALTVMMNAAQELYYTQMTKIAIARNTFIESLANSRIPGACKVTHDITINVHDRQVHLRSNDVTEGSPDPAAFYDKLKMSMPSPQDAGDPFKDPFADPFADIEGLSNDGGAPTANPSTDKQQESNAGAFFKEAVKAYIKNQNPTPPQPSNPNMPPPPSEMVLPGMSEFKEHLSQLPDDDKEKLATAASQEYLDLFKLDSNRAGALLKAMVHRDESGMELFARTAFASTEEISGPGNGMRLATIQHMLVACSTALHLFSKIDVAKVMQDIADKNKDNLQNIVLDCFNSPAFKNSVNDASGMSHSEKQSISIINPDKFAVSFLMCLINKVCEPAG